MGVYIYNICEVFIDDINNFGTNEHTFLARTLFQRNVANETSFNAEKLIIGFDTIPFIGIGQRQEY